MRTLIPFLVADELAGVLVFGGNTARLVHASLTGVTLSLPRVAANGGLRFHVDPGVFGFEIDLLASESFKFTNSTVVSDSVWKFEIKATSSGLATYDFSTLTLTMADVTLRDVAAFSAMTFINCPTVRQNNALIFGSTFAGSKLVADNPARVSICRFTSAGAGHGLEVTQPGFYAVSELTFEGFGADGTLDAALYNDSGGAVTLFILNGSAPTVRNGIGASTTIVVAVSMTLINVVAGSLIHVEREDNGELLEQRTASGANEVFWVLSGVPYRVRIRKASAAPVYQAYETIFPASTTNQSIFVSQIPDE